MREELKKAREAWAQADLEWEKARDAEFQARQAHRAAEIACDLARQRVDDAWKAYNGLMEAAHAR